MKISDLNEARRNPNHPAQKEDKQSTGKRKDYTDFLRRYVGEDCFVSFTQLNKLGINPQSEGGETPNGIYAFPLKFETPSDIHHFTRMPYMHIFKSKVELIDVSKYSIDEMKRDLQRLEEMYPTFPHGQQWDYFKIEVNQNEDDDDYIDASIIELYSDLLDDAPTPIMTPFSVIYTLTSYLANGNYQKWSSILHSIGIKGIVDYGMGVIHNLESAQAVFFKREYIEIVKTIQLNFDNSNKYFKTQHVNQRTVSDSDKEKIKDLSSKNDNEKIKLILTDRELSKINNGGSFDPLFLEFMKRQTEEFLIKFCIELWSTTSFSLQIKRSLTYLVLNIKPSLIEKLLQSSKISKENKKFIEQIINFKNKNKKLREL